MGRLQKNSCDYFPHDKDMRNHRKIKSLRKNFKNGYSFWCMFLEFLTGADGNVFENTEMEKEMLSGDFDITVTEISDILNYCIKIELLFEKDGFIYSESLNEILAPVYRKRGNAKELSKKQLRRSGKFVSKNIDTSDITVTEIPQSRVEYSIVDKSILNKSEISKTIFENSISISIDKISEIIFETTQFRLFYEKNKISEETAKKEFNEFIIERKIAGDSLVSIKEFWEYFINKYKKEKNQKNNKKLDHTVAPTEKHLEPMRKPQ